MFVVEVNERYKLFTFLFFFWSVWVCCANVPQSKVHLYSQGATYALDIHFQDTSIQAAISLPLLAASVSDFRAVINGSHNYRRETFPLLAKTIFHNWNECTYKKLSLSITIAHINGHHCPLMQMIKGIAGLPKLNLILLPNLKYGK